jgi:PTH1 family peptidyl-tRNA hydrolase
MNSIKLIVGLGNPGARHERDRHNAGYWFVDDFARAYGASFASESKFQGDACQANVAHRPVRLLKPTTFMNRSGQSVRAMTDYYRIAPEEVLVVHDELDLPPGTARLKRGGGHGGHNGLRDLISHIGRDFYRLRIGVGHPGDRNKVISFVLQPPTRAEETLIDDAIREGLSAVALFLREGEQKAMNQLHTRANAPRPTPPGPPGGSDPGAKHTTKAKADDGPAPGSASSSAGGGAAGRGASGSDSTPAPESARNAQEQQQ